MCLQVLGGLLSRVVAKQEELGCARDLDAEPMPWGLFSPKIRQRIHGMCNFNLVL